MSKTDKLRVSIYGIIMQGDNTDYLTDLVLIACKEAGLMFVSGDGVMIDVEEIEID